MFLIYISPMSIGERIKQARKEAGLSQEELGNLVGVGKSAVCLWESGQTKKLDGINLIKTAIALKLNPIWLALEKGDKSLFSVHDPIESGIHDVIAGAKAAIESSGVELSEREQRQIYKQCIDYFMDGFQLDQDAINHIIKLSTSICKQ